MLAGFIHLVTCPQFLFYARSLFLANADLPYTGQAYWAAKKESARAVVRSTFGNAPHLDGVSLSKKQYWAANFALAFLVCSLHIKDRSIVIPR